MTSIPDQFPPNSNYSKSDSAEFPALVQQPETINPREPLQPTSMLVREILETLLFTFFIVFLVKSATQNFRIEGASMLPTLHEGEYLIINKLIYYLEEPQRGDIIVLRFPNDRNRDFIKRVIGLPGDTVDISNGEVKVNGVVLNEPYISAPPNNNTTWQVPEDQFFVVGDNRPNSSDSRSWNFLPRSDIIGRAWVVYWPPSDWQFVPHFPHLYVPDHPSQPGS